MPLTLGILASSGTRTVLAYQTYQIKTNTANSFTYTGVSFGDADASRIVVVQATMPSSNIASVVIGGVTATIVRSAYNGSGMNGICYASVPSGTSGTVVVTASPGNNSANGSIIVWALYGVNPSPKSSGTKSSTTSYPALTLASGDIVILGDYVSGTTTYTNATKNAGFVLPFNGLEASGASYRATSAETRTITTSSGSPTTASFYAVWGR
jgi:hypothetical protein